MAWTTPTTRSTGDLITSSIWNTDLVNNLQYLHDNSLRFGGGLTTYSTQFGRGIISGGTGAPAVTNIPLITPWTTIHLTYIATVWPQTTWSGVTGMYSDINGLANGQIGIFNTTPQNFALDWVSIGI